MQSQGRWFRAWVFVGGIGTVLTFLVTAHFAGGLRNFADWFAVISVARFVAGLFWLPAAFVTRVGMEKSHL